MSPTAGLRGDSPIVTDIYSFIHGGALVSAGSLWRCHSWLVALNVKRHFSVHSNATSTKHQYMTRSLISC
jgi:hypothetical protein